MQMDAVTNFDIWMEKNIHARHVCTHRHTHTHLLPKWKKESLDLLILVIALSGKSLISGRKRPELQEKWRLEILTAVICMGWGGGGGGLHFKRSWLHFTEQSSVFGIWSRKWVRLQRCSILLYNCMRQQRGGSTGRFATNIYIYHICCIEIYSQNCPTIHYYRILGNLLLHHQLISFFLSFSSYSDTPPSSPFHRPPPCL